VSALHFSAASGVDHLIGWTILVPLVSAAVLLLGGRRTDRWGHLLGCAAPLTSFVFALAMLAGMLGHPGAHRSFDQHLFSWIPVNGFHVDASLLLDPLSMCFVLLITGVGSLIHIFSVGYMEHDPHRRRYFAYLNLFVAAMLLLVLGDSFLLLYVGWEGVGFASYILIGFWHHKPSAATAAKKAFIVNRVGDAGLSLAIMLMFATFGSTSFDAVFAGAGHAHQATLTALGFLMLLGACGKSAQFPLQTWLADAMEGPTPVSALIHAATMVTAGVYLVARANPIFNGAPDARLAVAAVGAFTLLFAAVIGCAKDDIKRVLAYSTVSQIGYMMLGVGLGPIGYAFGILHLLAHGFFKAGLFLGSGSVMHAMNDQTDMRRFGGLRKVMPVTFWTFGLAYLAIIGFPGLSGFWTKDKIIEAALDTGGVAGDVFCAAALVGVALTSYYMTRLMVMTFFGRPRWTEDVHPHESPQVMTTPMVLLAVGSVLFGALFTLVMPLAHFLSPVFGPTAEARVHVLNAWVLAVLGIASMLGGLTAAFVQYARRDVPEVAPTAVRPITIAARRDLYADAVNEAVLMRPGQYLTRALVFFDGRGVDGAVNGLAAFFGGASARVRRVQSGFVRGYALAMLFGAAAVAAALLLVRSG
jgi:NADH-quinone oxidoreductase subunit L